MLGTLGQLSRHGRFVLVAGLCAGLALPEVAMALRPWLSELVLLLLFITAFRVGFPNALAALRHLRETARVVLAYQLALPLLCICLFGFWGIADHPIAFVLTLMLAAPPLTGAPNLSVMLGHPPEPAFRLLIVGTILLPLTIIPIFWLSPALGSLVQALDAALHLCGVMSVTIAFAFLLRAILRADMQAREITALDGLTSLALAVIVIGLMSAVAPTLAAQPMVLAGWLLLAVVTNLGLQLCAYLLLRNGHSPAYAAPLAIVAGNRNVAIFLIAASASQSEEFLIFLGCYQFPMYLTPILMRPVLGENPLRKTD